MDYVRRARYRDGYDKEVFMESGKIYKVAFDVGWISQIFNAGHRIRVTVASTGAPFFEPNPNTGEPLTIEFPAKRVVANNAVHHDRDHSSRIIAPVCSIDERRGQLEHDLKELDKRLAKWRGNPDQSADAAIFSKGLSWALRHDDRFSKADDALLNRALQRGNERVAALEAGRTPWSKRKGKLVRSRLA
jgi:hypothetical protein